MPALKICTFSWFGSFYHHCRNTQTVRCNWMSNYACLEVLSSPSTDDAGLQMTQSILYGSSGVSWQSLDHGFHVLMDAWKRHQRRFPSPGAVLAAAMKVLCHRLFLRYADRVGWKQEHYRQFFNPFWLEPTAFTAAETSGWSWESHAPKFCANFMSAVALFLLPFLRFCFFFAVCFSSFQ